MRSNHLAYPPYVPVVLASVHDQPVFIQFAIFWLDRHIRILCGEHDLAGLLSIRFVIIREFFYVRLSEKFGEEPLNIQSFLSCRPGYKRYERFDRLERKFQ